MYPSSSNSHHDTSTGTRGDDPNEHHEEDTTDDKRRRSVEARRQKRERIRKKNRTRSARPQGVPTRGVSKSQLSTAEFTIDSSDDDLPPNNDLFSPGGEEPLALASNLPTEATSARPPRRSEGTSPRVAKMSRGVSSSGVTGDTSFSATRVGKGSSSTQQASPRSGRKIRWGGGSSRLFNHQERQEEPRTNNNGLDDDHTSGNHPASAPTAISLLPGAISTEATDNPKSQAYIESLPEHRRPGFHFQRGRAAGSRPAWAMRSHRARLFSHRQLEQQARPEIMENLAESYRDHESANIDDAVLDASVRLSIRTPAEDLTNEGIPTKDRMGGKLSSYQLCVLIASIIGVVGAFTGVAIVLRFDGSGTEQDVAQCSDIDFRSHCDKLETLQNDSAKCPLYGTLFRKLFDRLSAIEPSALPESLYRLEACSNANLALLGLENWKALQEISLESISDTSLLNFFALGSFYFGSNGMNWGPSSSGAKSWFPSSSIDECDEWIGITCNDWNQVVGIELPRESITSNSLPTELALLSSLELLDLGRNRIRGSIPSELLNLPSLATLVLSHCELTGAIPSNMSASLVHLDLDLNKLEGTIPPEIGQLENLEVFLAGFNKLSGKIPSTLYGLSRLSILDLSLNALTGVLAEEEISRLSNIETLGLANNFFDRGPIPTGLWELTKLTHLLLWRTNLVGSFPSSELGKLSRLEYLSLGENMLTGTLPTELGLLSNLAHLSANENNLQGTIPFEHLVLCTNLEVLRLEDNHLTGTIPKELLDQDGVLKNLTDVALYGNFLEGQLPDYVCACILGKADITTSWSVDFCNTYSALDPSRCIQPCT